ncbi:protein-tyrosine phosphatase domain-containing protein [Ditylenchus destructor]|nr:protein-tyrosine phosphatase domain-containing protein [Ditylenchus destructor]
MCKKKNQLSSQATGTRNLQPQQQPSGKTSICCSRKKNVKPQEVEKVPKRHARIIVPKKEKSKSSALTSQSSHSLPSQQAQRKKKSMPKSVQNKQSSQRKATNTAKKSKSGHHSRRQSSSNVTKLEQQKHPHRYQKQSSKPTKSSDHRMDILHQQSNSSRASQSSVRRVSQIKSSKQSSTSARQNQKRRQSKQHSKVPSEHVEKLRSFLHHTIRSDVQNCQKIFDTTRALLPKNATRLAFDANLSKCRFTDVICVDQSRVRINTGSSFIHASRVPISSDGKNEMILTQLPLKNTVMDFWRMVWDENLHTVFVILSNGEWDTIGSKLKIVPKADGCLHKSDGFCIVFQQEVVVSAVWSVTCYGLSWKGIHRSIQWIHYTGWEHAQAPSETKTIWQIHSYLRRSKKPIVCMSMSGVGRAGSYAVLEVAHDNIHDRQNNMPLKLTECVQKVRDFRMHALQNQAQYNFIQIALVDHLLTSQNVRNDLEHNYIDAYQKLRQNYVK